MESLETPESAGIQPVAVAARPRTLVLAIGATRIDARMFGPTRQPLGAPVQLTTPASPRAISSLWPVLEALGEFDRVSVIVEPSLETHGPEWSPAALAEELQRQTGRRVRHVTMSELRTAVIRGQGVELVLAVGSPLAAWHFVDGVAMPGFALGRHPFRKDRTYAEYLAPEALVRKGPHVAARRLARVAAVITDVWSPAALHIWLPDAVALEGDVQHARLHRTHGDHAAAVSLWAGSLPR